MTIHEINTIIEEGEALKTIASAYTEIASIRIQRIRGQVLKSRAFFNEILNIYALVRKTAIQKRKPGTPQKKAASILITSNNRFYGHIDTEIVKLFLNQGDHQEKGDVFAVGVGGKEALEAYHFSPFKSIMIKKDMPGSEELANIAEMVGSYVKVLIYFAQFQTVMKQNPVVVDITESQSSALAQSKKLEGAFIFEPEAGKILDFFDSQLKQVLIEQTFLESELARTGSRLISMDQAEVNADKFVKDNHILLLQAKRSVQNAQILETIASFRKANL